MTDTIIIEGVTKTFNLPHEKHSTLKQAALNIHKRKSERFVALNDINFSVKKGEFFGIVGRNGSGKSTLLKIIAGIYTPDKGKVQVNGSLVPFIELGVGFNPELSGRDNVFLNGALLGFSRKEMTSMYDEIVEFAELERFMDQKLKNYSSGMQVRLAFSIAIRAQSDILLIDEVLAVGDSSFQQKCYDYFDKLKQSDKTVVFISHDLGAIQSFCDRAILINNGEMVAEGLPVEVSQKYTELIVETSEQRQFEADKLTHIGVGGAEVIKGEVLDSKGKPTTKIKEGEPFSVRLYYKTSANISEPVVGIGIMGEKGQSIIGPNTKESGFKIDSLLERGHVEATFPTNPLSPGTYRLRGGIFNLSVTIPYDFVEKLGSFTITGKKRYGDIYIDPEWRLGK